MTSEAQVKLLDTLSSLAMYNDKGYVWMNHSPSAMQVERQAMMARINALAEQIGLQNLPEGFISALQSGALETDPMGGWALILRRHFADTKEIKK